MYAENYITPCSNCYSYTLPVCPVSNASITIKGALGNTQSRQWYVEDKFGKVTTGTATTNSSGDLAIPISEFPEGYFMEFSGKFVIYVKATEASTTILEMTFNTVTYECIDLNFADIDSTNLIIQ
jgi:hypothetical protein